MCSGFVSGIYVYAGSIKVEGFISSRHKEILMNFLFAGCFL